MKREFNAAVTIGRPTHSSGKECVRISVEDVDTQKHVVQIEMDLDEFARAITGFGYRHCTGTIWEKTP